MGTARGGQTGTERHEGRAGEGQILILVDTGERDDADETLMVRAARVVLEAERVEDAELSIALVDDDAMAALNVEHLGREGPTDVLAFALWTDGEPVVGDIYVGVDQARRQALEQDVPFREELVRLTVHGVLHVLGWDHPGPAEERSVSPMFARQEELVAAVTATTA